MEKNYEYKKLYPFKWFVLENFPFIEEDFDAITNWQLFCKLGKEMNKIIDSVNLSGEQVEILTDSFSQLKDYVNNFFDNLDVQDEINNKLDEMAQDGTLLELISTYLNSKAIFCFDNVNDMKSATNLVNGSFAKTLGYYNKNDGGKAIYKIREITNSDIIDNGSLIPLNQNNLVAELIEKFTITPEMFGAYGDNIHDDHNALINTFKYAYNNRIELDENNYSSIPIKFNTKKYLNDSTIVFDSSTTLANNIVIFGNGGFITGHGLKFTQNAGWKLDIKDLKFANMTNAFEFDERNIEYGNFIFEHLEFIYVENPFIMNRRSCLVDIKNCIFRAVSSIGEFTNVDRLYFHENWIEPISTISNLDYKSMLKQNAGYEGAMFIYNNLFVPVGGNNSKELCWIEVNKHARIYNNRFGGENTNYHPLRVGSGFITNNISSPHPYLSFDHNDEVVGNTSIIIENVCGTMLFTDNQGYNSGGKIIEWSDKVSEEQQTTIIEQQANMLNLVISNNNGRNLYRNGNGNGVATVYLPTIPKNLYGVCNRGMRSTTERTGENRAYLDYLEPTQATTQTITIKKQPFDNISSASLGSRFTFVSSFSIMCWCGFGYSTNYECKTTYMLITFSLNETTLTIKKNFIGEELDIDVSFSNDTNTIDITTLNNVSDLEIKIFSTTNKVLKFLKAQIFRPHNELTSFM